MAMGAMIAGVKDAVCITGDFSFLAVGILGFNEPIIHGGPLKLIIFNNGKAHATGGQELNPDLLDNFCRSYRKSIVSIKMNSAKEEEIETELEKYLKRSELSVLILEIE